LLEPDDVAAGHVIWFQRASPDRIVRSRRPAHPVIVSIEDFTQAQLLRRSKAAGGLATARGRSRWAGYGERLGTARADAVRSVQSQYAGRDCATDHLLPLHGADAALADQPATVNLREDAVLKALNGWIQGLFTRENVDQTVAALMASQDGTAGSSAAREATRARLAKAEARLRRLRATAIEAGVDPAALVESINEAQTERAAARAELQNASLPDMFSEAEIYAMIDALGDIDATVAQAKPASLSRLYQRLRLQLRYEPGEPAIYVTAQPRVDSARVRGRELHTNHTLRGRWWLGPAPAS
jgi:hypothetical protein